MHIDMQPVISLFPGLSVVPGQKDPSHLHPGEDTGRVIRKKIDGADMGLMWRRRKVPGFPGRQLVYTVKPSPGLSSVVTPKNHGRLSPHIQLAIGADCT